MKNHRKIIAALAMIAPIYIRHRLGSLAYCGPASSAGAAALRRLGIQAQAVPISAVIRARNGRYGTLGHTVDTAREAYDRLGIVDAAPVASIDDPYPRHAVIHAKIAGGATVTADLTIGQVRDVTPALDVPESFVADCAYPSSDWVTYEPCPYVDAIIARDWETPMPAAFVDDLLLGVRIALAFDLDPQRVAVGMAEALG